MRFFNRQKLGKGRRAREIFLITKLCSIAVLCICGIRNGDTRCRLATESGPLQTKLLVMQTQCRRRLLLVKRVSSPSSMNRVYYVPATPDDGEGNADGLDARQMALMRASCFHHMRSLIAEQNLSTESII